MIVAIGELLGYAAPYLARMLPTLLPQAANVARVAGMASNGTRVGSALLKGADLASKFGQNQKALTMANRLGDLANLGANTADQHRTQIAELMANGLSEEDANQRANLFTSVLRGAGSSAADILTAQPGASGSAVAKALGLRLASGGIQGIDTAMMTGRNPFTEALSGASQGLLSGLPEMSDLLYTNYNKAKKR
jgi:hypothetical protein